MSEALSGILSRAGHLYAAVAGSPGGGPGVLDFGVGLPGANSQGPGAAGPTGIQQRAPGPGPPKLQAGSKCWRPDPTGLHRTVLGFLGIVWLFSSLSPQNTRSFLQQKRGGILRRRGP